jgi:hypothetical protein
MMAQSRRGPVDGAFGSPRVQGVTDMARRRPFTIALTLSAGLLSACASDPLPEGRQEFPGTEGSEARQRAQEVNPGSALDAAGVSGTAAGVTFGNPSGGDPLAGNVNRHLWLASLEVLDFLPILSTDPFTGVIATDWGSTPDAAGERFRVNAYVTDVALTPNALRVAVFREVLNAQGAWVSAPVADSTPREIEDAILVRARQIRIAEAEAANAAG